MSRVRRIGSALFGAILVTSGAACGGDVEPVEAPPAFAAPSGDPLSRFPREELYGASPEDNLWSPRYELDAPDLPVGWNGARFAILSDLQLGLWEGNEAVVTAAVRAAVEADPDVVLLLGDYLARGEDLSAVERALSPLRGRSTVAVLGDRDIRTDTLEARLTQLLGTLGIRVLRNGSVPLERGGDTIHIAGLDPDILGETWNDQRYILATVGVRRRTPILLTHNPAMVTRAPMHRFPIVVAGNTFCGQVEVPGTPRLSWLRSEVFPSAAIPGSDRLFRVRGSTVLVTCGVGYGFVPLRFGAAPEVPVLTVIGAGEEITQPDDAAAAADSIARQLQPPDEDDAAGD